MTAQVTTPGTGRGAWPSSGAGGTLSTDGTKPGGYYRTPAPGTKLPLVGTGGFRADRDNAPITVDEYAVWRAAVAFQTHTNRILRPALVVDGMWGPATDAAVRGLQERLRVTVDGVVGPRTAQAVWLPYLQDSCERVDPTHQETLETMCRGHIGLESGWDLAAVGRTTPQDLGLGQINGPAHPDLSVNQRLDPVFTTAWVASFVDANLRAMGFDRDLAIAAYNLGQGGARSWDRAGRPDVWQRTATSVVEVRRYINLVLAAAT